MNFDSFLQSYLTIIKQNFGWFICYNLRFYFQRKQSAMNKCALITGVTGQDGAYLSEFLLEKGYIVHGIKRRTSLFNTDRVDHLYNKFHEHGKGFNMHHGDMTDSSSLIHIIEKTKPDEIYNIAAQSHVAVSFEEPEYTANSDALGPLRMLEAIRTLGLAKKVRYYQASTSEMYGQSQESPQNEDTPFHPCSPYAAAKLYAYWISLIYREAYGIYAVNGILFNHESKKRGETFVTRKITRGLSRIKHGLQDYLALGNLDSLRDWGHARDYVEAQWLMLQQEKPKDYVIALGEQRSVRNFVEVVAKRMDMQIEWQGAGVDEQGVDTKTGNVIIKVDSRYFRPFELEALKGDASRARAELGWQPKVTFDELVDEMVAEDLRLAELEKLYQQ